MDSLDTSTHQSILSALAESYASSNQVEEPVPVLRDLPSSGNVVANGSPVDSTDTAGSGPNSPRSSAFLGLFGFGKSGGSFGGLFGAKGSQREPISRSQVAHVVAYAAYVSKAASRSATVQSHALDRLLRLVAAMPGWDVEETLAAESPEEYPLVDELAHRLVSAALDAGASSSEADRHRVVGALSSALADITSGVQRGSSDPVAVVTHFIPLLSGFRRAITRSAFPFTPDLFAGLFPPLHQFALVSPSADIVELVNSTCGGRLGAPSAVGPQYVGVLSRYEALSLPLSMGFVSHATLQSCRVALQQSLLDEKWPPLVGHVQSTSKESWALLGLKPAARGVAIRSGAADVVRGAINRSLELFEEVMNLVGSLDDDQNDAGTYALEIASEALKLATVGSIALDSLDQDLLDVLKALHGESATVYDPLIQMTATECLVVILRNYPGQVAFVSRTLRHYLTAPLPIFETARAGVPSDALLSAAHGISVCIETAQSPDFTTTTLYSILNHVRSTHAGGSAGSASGDARSVDARSFATGAAGQTRSEGEKRQVAVDSVHAVGAIAAERRTPEITSLSTSMLLQRLRGTEPSVSGAIMSTLADLAGLAMSGPKKDHHLFDDVVLAFSDVSKSSATFFNPDDPSHSNVAVLAAQTRLAAKVGGDPQACSSYLHELLKLFIDKGKGRAQGAPASAGEKAQLGSLIGLIPVIGTLLAENSAAGYEARDTEEHELVVLFRNFWFLCVLLGFTNSGFALLSDYQLGSLAKIAKHTPPLSRGAPLDYIENELEYNPLLRPSQAAAGGGAEGAKVQSGQKAELAQALPSHAGQIRGMTHAQATFLLTVLRLEVLRAQESVAAPALQYVQNEGIGGSSLFDCLTAIADKALIAYVEAFQHQAIRHKVADPLYDDIRNILIACTHHSDRARNVALRHMQGLVTSYPTLLCHYQTVATLLEILTLLRSACEGQYEDEYSPTYEFHSRLVDLTLHIPDDYAARERTLKNFHSSAKLWLGIAVNRAPLETQSILTRYIDGLEDTSSAEPRPEMGRSLALDLVRVIPDTQPEAHLPRWGDWKADGSIGFANTFAHRTFYSGEAADLKMNLSAEKELPAISELREDLRRMTEQVTKTPKKVKPDELRRLLYRAGAATVAAQEVDYEVLHRIVVIPIRVFTPAALAHGQEVWTWLVDSRPEVEAKLMTDVITMWGWTIRRRRGLFSNHMNAFNPLDRPVELTPTDREETEHNGKTARRLLAPHSSLLDFLASRFQAARYKNRNVVLATLRLVTRSTRASKLWSTHPLARELRLRLLTFGFTILQGSRQEAAVEHVARDLLYDAAFGWFEHQPSFAFGNSRAQQETDVRLLDALAEVVGPDKPANEYFTSSLDGDAAAKLPGNLTPRQALSRHNDRHHLLRLLIENERVRLFVWLNPLSDPKRGKDPDAVLARSTSELIWRRVVISAWNHSPALAVRLLDRFKQDVVKNEVEFLVKRHPEKARTVAEALHIFLGEKLDTSMRPQFRHLLYWTKVPVVNGLKLFLPQFENDPTILQYGMRMLEEHPVDVTFFYIPQVVQALRTDELGYIERFISATAKVSQLFCHQIIWNMKANTYKDDEGEDPDPMKPQLDRMVDLIVEALSGEAKDFYEREFSFFDEVTSISRKLMPYLKKSKAEKKAKIAEELGKIKVDQGVYLPSNPDGSVVDIDRNSGRPLQSHAKTPFMATFKVHREKIIHEDEDDDEDEGVKQGVDQWQAAIFKVGDDCRQDVLALQIIAMAKAIYEAVFLDVHLVPYRVTATAPGCGVIDVIPDATSRDEMGRAQINDLNTFFHGKFGATETETFQKARTNFIRSMAAYSVLCHVMQIRDRHNGNLMIDGTGHIAHIDFGFLFDIGPGGVHFEPPSFKLTHEMIAVMGGPNSPGLRQFRELTVKSYLAVRPFIKELVGVCKLMEGTQLPSYTGEGTMIRLLDRFKPDLNEREAAVHMSKLIDNAETNVRSLVYDEFQLRTNAIPYAK